MRKIISLNGRWEASYDGRVYDRRLDVPGTVPLKSESYPDPESLVCYYKKTIELCEEDLNKKKILKFYGSDLITTLIVNGIETGVHEGGFDSFEFDVTGILTEKINEIIVRVEDRPIGELKDTITGKQDWYGNVTGIWQPVELIFNDETYINSRRLITGKDNIDVSLDIVGNWDSIEYSLFDGRSLESYRKVYTSEFSINRNDLKLWSPESPKLYDLVLEIIKAGEVIYREEFKVGFREIIQRDGEILINDLPFYMKGLLDQDFYPETHYVHPSEEYLREQLLRIKSLGFNTLRYHVKIPPEKYVELANELGLLLWIDLPYAVKFDSGSKKYLKKLREDLMKRYSKEPSFCILTLINESWGVDLNEKEEMKWLEDFWFDSKEKIKDRLIVDNSPCEGNHHVRSDINDFHFYFSYPENVHKWDKAIEDFSNDIFVPFEEVEKNKKEEDLKIEKLPKIISEFGVWGLSDPVLWKGNWMKYPLFGIKKIEEMVSEIVPEFGRDPSSFFKELQWQEFAALKYQIEKIRIGKSIRGFILTELSDIAWEANGILDFSRNDKPFTDYLKILNSQILPIMDRDGNLYISNISNEKFNGELIVRFNNDVVEKKIVECKGMDVTEVSHITVPGKRGMIFLSCISEGKTVSENSYATYDNIIDGDVEIFEELSKEAYESAEKGNTVYVQMKEPGKHEDFEVVGSDWNVVANRNLTWEGNWIKGFLYYDKGLMNRLNYMNGGRELEGIFTDNVMINCDGYNILIGKTIGWNIAKCACLIQKNIGKGKIIISTLNLKFQN
ncbi:MAG: hypothetical protein PWQ77_2033 [Kosmotogales bacterium]|nr:hypothetical protein [Kosmotogales bacterium]